MTPGVALLDANVLYPAPLRDLLLQLAFDWLYRARWSARIDDEWTRYPLAARSVLAGRIERTRAVMHQARPDAQVRDYTHLIRDLSLPDPDYRHVLAAAVAAAAEVIVTFNLKDFPTAALAEYGVEAQHPNAFLNAFIEAEPLDVLDAVRACFPRLTHPPLAVTDYLAVMRRLGLTRTAMFLDTNRPGWER